MRSGSEAAAARPGFGGYWNRLQIFVVMVWKLPGSARIAGVPKSVSERRKATSMPARIAGSASGRVMRQAVRQGRAPRIAEASSMSPGMRSSAFATSTKTKGKA